MEIKSRKSLITNAKDFYQCAQKLDKINVIYVETEEIEAAKNTLDDKWNLVKGIPNITSCHNFRFLDNYQVGVKNVFNSNKSSVVLCFSM